MPDISSPWIIMEIREDIEEAIKEIHSDPDREDGLYIDPKFRESVELRFKEAFLFLDISYDYAYNIQKLIGGDNGDESFLKALAKDLNGK